MSRPSVRNENMLNPSRPDQNGKPAVQGGNTLGISDSHNPPPGYTAPIVCEKITEQRDVMVPMRDGKHLCADIYRPDMPGKFPALLAIAPHNKEYQTPEFAKAAQWAQPAWSRMWFGGAEGGDTDYLVRRGYVHVCANVRGTGKSGGGGSPEWDLYDLIEWMAVQPWGDGNVGMIGISAFGGSQFQAAAQQPPHLKAIFPCDPMGCYGQWGFRDFYPGGLVHTMVFLLDSGAVYHVNRGQPGALPPEQENKWRQAVGNDDFMMYPNIFNVLVEKGQTMPLVYDTLLNPYDADDIVEKTEALFKKIKIPFYTGTGWYGYTYKLHLQGSQQWFQNVDGVPKKLLFTGPAHLERPFHSFHDEILRWYDHWLKGKSFEPRVVPAQNFVVEGMKGPLEMCRAGEQQFLRHAVDVLEPLLRALQMQFVTVSVPAGPGIKWLS